jgi:hypothetical protein
MKLLMNFRRKGKYYPHKRETYVPWKQLTIHFFLETSKHNSRCSETLLRDLRQSSALALFVLQI